MKTNRIIVLFLLLCLISQSAWSAATFSIIIQDGANEGFNDTTAVAPVGGNTGTTLGQQRLKVFERASELWGEVINSSVEIKIAAKFDALTCGNNSATLGSAGSNFVFRNFPNAPFANTFYSAALADSLAGSDQNPGEADINATFNSAIDTGCFNDGWYYGLDGNTPPNKTSLLPVVLHELGHGLGFQTFTSGSTGALLGSFPSVWDRFLFDLTANKSWVQMATDAERAASAINGPNLVWTGTKVTGKYPEVLEPPVVFEITSPAAIANSYSFNFAQFGDNTPNTVINTSLVLADDGTGPDVNDGCSPIANNINGQIALIKRGNCAFTTKAKNAQNAGASVAVIMNNESGNITLAGTDATVTIPVVSISQEDGNLILAQINAGIDATFGYDNSRYAGVNGDFVMMYAPKPFESGSSVSHFSTEASPSLLMEPRISPNLHDQVDLTRELFEDIGWSVNADTGNNDIIFKNGFEAGQ